MLKKLCCCLGSAEFPRFIDQHGSLGTKWTGRWGEDDEDSGGGGDDEDGDIVCEDSSGEREELEKVVRD